MNKQLELDGMGLEQELPKQVHCWNPHIVAVQPEQIVQVNQHPVPAEGEVWQLSAELLAGHADSGEIRKRCGPFLW